MHPDVGRRRVNGAQRLQQRLPLRQRRVVRLVVPVERPDALDGRAWVAAVDADVDGLRPSRRRHAGAEHERGRANKASHVHWRGPRAGVDSAGYQGKPGDQRLGRVPEARRQRHVAPGRRGVRRVAVGVVGAGDLSHRRTGRQVALGRGALRRRLQDQRRRDAHRQLRDTRQRPADVRGDDTGVKGVGGLAAVLAGLPQPPRQLAREQDVGQLRDAVGLHRNVAALAREVVEVDPGGGARRWARLAVTTTRPAGDSRSSSPVTSMKWPIWFVKRCSSQPNFCCGVGMFITPALQTIASSGAAPARTDATAARTDAGSDSSHAQAGNHP